MLWRRTPLVSLCLYMGLGRIFGQADPAERKTTPPSNPKDSRFIERGSGNRDGVRHVATVRK